MSEESSPGITTNPTDTVTVDRSFLQSLSDGVSNIKNFIFRKESAPSPSYQTTPAPTEELAATVSAYMTQKESQEALRKAQEVSEKAREELLLKKAAEQVELTLKEKAHDTHISQVVDTFMSKVQSEETKTPGFTKEVSKLNTFGDDNVVLWPYLNQIADLKGAISYVTDPDKLLEVSAVINSIKSGNQNVAKSYFNNLETKLKKAPSYPESLRDPLSSSTAGTRVGAKNGFQLGMDLIKKRTI